MLKVLDTFAGAGGFSLGFELAGYDVIGAIEIDKWASETFASNHTKSKILVGDVATFSNEYLYDFFKDSLPDIILGGPPCQGFSICTKNAGDPKDPRNSLFMEMIRLAKVFNPKYMIIENVPNIIKAMTSSNELVIDIIKRELEAIGYHVYYKILQATDYGVPQIRKRLFIIASCHELEQPFPVPTHTINNCDNEILGEGLLPCPNLWDAISDLPDIEAREGAEIMNYDKKPFNQYQSMMHGEQMVVYNHVSMKHSKRVIERFASMSWGDTLLDVPQELRPYQRNGNGIISDKIYDQNNRRMHPDRPCHTVPASFYANFVHPYKNRNFTAREGARIQSFPDWYVFKGKPTVVSKMLLEREGRTDEKYLCQYNQIGNAVPPLLSKAVAINLLRQIK